MSFLFGLVIIAFIISRLRNPFKPVRPTKKVKVDVVVCSRCGFEIDGHTAYNGALQCPGMYYNTWTPVLYTKTIRVYV